MYVFNANGILCRRIPFHPITEVHGEPVSTSNDGRYIVLKVPIASIKQTLRYLNRDVNGKESRDAIRQALRLSVFEVTPFGLLEIKQIDIWDGIKKFFDNNTKAYEQFKDAQKDFIYPETLKLLTKRTGMQILINEDADVLVKFYKRHPKDEFGQILLNENANT